MKYFFPNLFPRDKYGRSVGSSISAIENIQEEFEHDIREVKEHLTRLISLFEDYIKTQAVLPRGPSSVPTQYASRPSPRAFVQTTRYLPRGTDRPSLRQPMPSAPPIFVATSRPVDQPSGSRGKLSRQKIDKDKPRWDPILITYTELFPKLVKIDHIEPVHLAPLKLPFPRWYNAHAWCDYHVGNLGHSTKNCTVLKRKVWGLINDGKLKFEDLDRLAQFEDPSKVKVEMARQKNGTPRETSLGKATMPKEKVPIAEVRRSEAMIFNWI